MSSYCTLLNPLRKGLINSYARESFEKASWKDLPSLETYQTLYMGSSVVHSDSIVSSSVNLALSGVQTVLTSAVITASTLSASTASSSYISASSVSFSGVSEIILETLADGLNLLVAPEPNIKGLGRPRFNDIAFGK